MPTSQRYALVDAMRGLAIVMMFSFHFSYDLSYFGFVSWNFYTDPFWINYRVVIVSSFLFVVGISLYLAHHREIHWPRFWRRFAIMLGCALLVSISSYVIQGERFIYFGILHFITLASLLGLLCIRWYWLNLALGIAIIYIGSEIHSVVFNPVQLNWIGLMTVKPATEDYVPLLPWFGVVCLGIFFGRFAVGENHFPPLRLWQGKNPAARGLRLLGRHSLLIYMLHQPVFFGVLFLVKQLVSHT